MFILRNDKYSKKVYKYFVEYADKKAKKKTHTEIERHSTQQEAGTISAIQFKSHVCTHLQRQVHACMLVSYACSFHPKPLIGQNQIYV